MYIFHGYLFQRVDKKELNLIKISLFCLNLLFYIVEPPEDYEYDTTAHQIVLLVSVTICAVLFILTSTFLYIRSVYNPQKVNNTTTIMAKMLGPPIPNITMSTSPWQSRFSPPSPCTMYWFAEDCAKRAITVYSTLRNRLCKSRAHWSEKTR